MVYDLNIPHAASEYERVTLSAGLAVKNADDNKTIDYVMLEADKNLYVAKTSGRNQLVAPTSKAASKVETLSPPMKMKAHLSLSLRLQMLTSAYWNLQR